MTSLWQRLGAVLLLSVGLVTSVPGVASAQTVTVTDGANDVGKVEFAGGDIRVQGAPEERLIDVVRAKIRYQRDALVVVATMADVTKTSKSVSFAGRVKGGGGESYFTSSGRSGLFRFVDERRPANGCGRLPRRDLQAQRGPFHVACSHSGQVHRGPPTVRVGLSQSRFVGKQDDFGQVIDDLDRPRVSTDNYFRTRLGAPARRG